jgi:hypothetical protein
MRPVSRSIMSQRRPQIAACRVPVYQPIRKTRRTRFSHRAAHRKRAASGTVSQRVRASPAELVKETLILLDFGILLHPHLLIGGSKSRIRVQFETSPGAISTGRRHRGDTKKSRTHAARNLWSNKNMAVFQVHS